MTVRWNSFYDTGSVGFEIEMSNSAFLLDTLCWI